MADPKKLYSKSLLDTSHFVPEYAKEAILSYVTSSLTAMESVGKVDWSTFQLEIKPTDGSFGIEPRPGLLQVVATATVKEN